MTKLRDGYFRQVDSKVGDDNYLLKAKGGYIGLHTGRNNEANKVVRTDEYGYIQAGWINTTSGSMDGSTPARIYASYDGYIRYMTPAYFFSNLSNDSNQLSITVAGQNRKLTVAYASSASSASYLTLNYSSNSSNSGAWSTIKNGTSNPQSNKFQVWTIYNDGGPTTYGEMIEILSYNSNHWQPQLWFGAGKGAHMYYRNKNYADNTWGDWLTILDSGNTYISDGWGYINTTRINKARYVIGDNDAQNPGGALLHSGSGRADNSSTGDTWIFYDTLGGTSSPWGFRHNQGNNSIGFIGQGTEWCRIPLYSGVSGYIGSSLMVGSNSNPSYTLDVNGTSHISNYLWVDGTIARGNEHIISPKGGSYTSNAYSETGYIIVRFPYSLIYCMMSVWIDIYSYATNHSCSIHCGAYTYDSSFGHAPFSRCIGRQLKTRFCYDSDYYYIVVGESDSVWYYPKFIVRDMLVGYSRTAGNWIDKTLYCYISSTLPGTESTSIDEYIPTVSDNNGKYLRKDTNDSTSYQYSFTKTNDHAIQVGTIRGYSYGANGQSGEYIHLYERVHIGSPNGWGSRNAPSYGLSTYGGAWLATDTGNVGIGTTSPGYKLDVNGNIHGSHFYMGGYLYMTFGGSWLSTIDNDGNGPIFGHALALNNRRAYYVGSPVYICGGSYSNYANGITVDSSNNVGIAATAPAAKLHIHGSILYDGADATMKIYEVDGGYDCGPETVAIQTCFDRVTTPDSHSYVNDYRNRCFLSLQPRNGVVGITETTYNRTRYNNATNSFVVNGLANIGKSTLDNTAFTSTLTLFANQNNESYDENFNESASSWGITFKRQWDTGNQNVTSAGIYAVGSGNWRTGLAFRVKNNTTTAGYHDITAIWISPKGSLLQQNYNSWLSPARVQIGRLDSSTYSDRAVIGATNGNLHIDPYNGYHTYLNYYSHGKVYFNGETYCISADGSYYNGTAEYSYNSDKLDGYHYNNLPYAPWKEQWIDMTGYSESYWHPVVTSLPYAGYRRIKVTVQLNSGTAPSWSTHSSGFTCNLDLWTTAHGWGTTTSQTICLNSTYGFADQNPVGWYQLGNASHGILLLRGGGKYLVCTDWDSSWTIYNQSTTDYGGTQYEQTCGPYTSWPGIFNGSTTKNWIYAHLQGNIITDDWLSIRDYAGSYHGRSNNISGYAGEIWFGGNFHIDSQNGYNLYLNYYSQYNTFINPRGGNVGIGTDSPSSKLHISGSTGVTIEGTGGGPYLTVNYNSRYDSDNSLDNYGINLIKFGKSSMDNYLGTGLNTGYSGYFGRQSYVFHTGSSYAFGWYSSGWTCLMELQGATGNLWTKGWVYANYLHSRGNLYVQGTSYFGRDSYGDTYYINGPNYTGNATTASYPYGFTSRGTSDWSGVSGTFATDWSVNGADIMFKYDGSKLNVITDGRFYQGIDIYGASKRVLDEYDISHTKWSDADTLDGYHYNELPYIQRLNWWNYGDSHNANDLLSGTTFAYSNHSNCPTTGTIVAFNCINSTGYPLQLQGQYGGENLYFRNRNGDNGTWQTWRYVIHSGNIGSQSVNYANSAGYATRAAYLDGHGVNPDNSHPGYGARVFYSWNTGQAGNSSSGYSNGITIGSHPNDTAYGFQIVQNMWDDNTYTRRYNGGWQSWRTLLNDANWTSYVDGRYLKLSGGTMNSGAQILCASINTSSDIYNGGIQLREANYATSSLDGSNMYYGPGITFHWGGYWVHKLNMHSDALYWDNSIIITSSNINTYAPSSSVDYTIWRDNSNSTDYKIQVVSSLPSSTNSNTFYVIV